MGERLRILELIEAGEISVEEGVRRLEALAEGARRRIPPPPAPSWCGICGRPRSG